MLTAAVLLVGIGVLLLMLSAFCDEPHDSEEGWKQFDRTASDANACALSLVALVLIVVGFLCAMAYFGLLDLTK